MSSIFAERTRELRTEKDITQEELGKAIGKAKSAVSNWEQGTRFPDQETLIALADYFSVTIDYLLGRSDYRKGRIMTEGELLSFIPPGIIKKHKLEVWLDEAELSDETKEEIREALKRHGYMK